MKFAVVRESSTVDTSVGMTHGRVHSVGRWMRTTCAAMGLSLMLAATPVVAALPFTPQWCVGSAVPGGSPGCGEDGASSVASPNSHPLSIAVGNPINLVTGNKYQQETDLPALPGVLGLEIVRHYNSAYANERMAPGLVGRGWRLSYETELVVGEDKIQILQADGGRVIFSRDPKHPSLCASSNPDDGTLRIDERAARIETTYTWTWSDGRGEASGRRLVFDARGKLIRIEAASGEVLRLERENGLAGRLTKVIDPAGRQLLLAYPVSKAPQDGIARPFEGVATIDSPVGRFAYVYGGEDVRPLPAGQATLVATLREVRLPGDVRRIYHHEDARHPMALTGISVVGNAATPPATAERLSSWAYDAQGRAVVSVRGAMPKVGEEGQGIEYLRVTAFKAPVGMTPGHAEIVNSLGQATRYETRVIAGLPRIVRSRGLGCVTCPPGNMQWGYDSRALLVSTARVDAQGRPLAGERIARDELGRPVATFEQRYDNGKLVAEAQLVSLQYAGTSRDPIAIERPSGVAGKSQRLEFVRNARGQLVAVKEMGYSPIDAQGRLNPTAMVREATRTFEVIAGRSVMVATQSPAGVMRATWDEGGNRVVALSDATGTSRIEHDQAGRVHRVSHESGVATTHTLDAAGREVRLERSRPGWAKVQVISLRRDALGRIVETGRGGGDDFRPAHAQGYDAAGRVAWQAQALGFVETRRYDTEGRLIESGRIGGTMRQVQQFGYAPDGQLAHVRDNAGRPWSAVFHRTSGAQARDPQSAPLSPVERLDDWGRAVQTVSPDSGTTTRVFDAADRLVAMTDAVGNRASYRYDTRGRIERQDVTSGMSPQEPANTTRWIYEGERLVRLEHPTQDERYEYDSRGLRTARIVTIKAGGTTLTSVTRYTFDVDGILQSSTLPDGSELMYRRNGQGQVVGMDRKPWRTPWVRSLAKSEAIVSEVERDMIGLKALTAGNGVRTRWQRTREGHLERMVHATTRRAHAALRDQDLRERFGRATLLAIDLMLGISPVQAAQLPSTSATPTAKNALTQAFERDAFVDRRYLWDVAGNLRLVQDPRGWIAYAYDASDRLLAVEGRHGSLASETGASNPVASEVSHLERYHYDAHGRRVLAQQGTSERAATFRVDHQPGTHRRSDSRHDLAGQPVRRGDNRMAWDAYGRLSAIEGAVQARYGYDHRGLRNVKIVGGKTTFYLHDEDRNLVAEYGQDGRVERAYVYLADLPVAMLVDGRAMGPATPGLWSTLTTLAADARAAWDGAASGARLRIAFLHLNHLGAPELATDESGQPVWRADYSAFGSASVDSRIKLNLRLPGQYFDAESGLHYNRQRYYDPMQGAYVSPDPLGFPDGLDPYTYVRFSPLRHVDPDGLVLFAFDGTGNSFPAPRGDTVSNVRKFYADYTDGPKWYMNGIGRPDPDSRTGLGLGYNGLMDMLTGETARARVDYMLGQLDSFVAKQVRGRVHVDVIGFSRGASMGRDFSNRVDGWLQQNRWGVRTACTNLRFMGLWDTVAQFGLDGAANLLWKLKIPASVAYAAHAVALNEHRRLFPAESIGVDVADPDATRITRGFIGSHSDIGGSYGHGDLSDVALSWMIRQARVAGVEMAEVSATDLRVSLPWVHDMNMVPGGNYPDLMGDRWICDRENHGLQKNCIKQKDARFGASSLSYAGTKEFVVGQPVRKDPSDGSLIVGMVDMERYAHWLRLHYDLEIPH